MLNSSNVHNRLLQAVNSFIAEVIIPNATGDYAAVAEDRSHVSKISRGAAKPLLSSWQDVPEQLA